VLIYLTYSNLLNVVQSWIEQGKMSFGVGLVGLHVIVALVVAVIFWLRVRNRPLFTRATFSRSNRPAQGA
jgi:lipopolysaccharide export system permease protein